MKETKVAQTKSLPYFFMAAIFALGIVGILSSLNSNLNGKYLMILLVLTIVTFGMLWLATYGRQELIVTSDSLVRKWGTGRANKIPWDQVISVTPHNNQPLLRTVRIAYSKKDDSGNQMTKFLYFGDFTVNQTEVIERIKSHFTSNTDDDEEIPELVQVTK